MERYANRKAANGQKYAKQKLIKEVFQLLRPEIIRPIKSSHKLNYLIMFKHNMLISLRSFRRYKSTFLINLFGLATGLASVLLIYLWVSDELNTDKFNEKDSERHVQVIHTYPTSGSFHTEVNGATPNPLFERLPKDLPEIEYAFPVMARPEYRGVLSHDNARIRSSYQFIGEGYFNVFPAEFIHGNKFEILKDKGEVAISEKLANTLFESTEAAVGKLVDFKSDYYSGAYLVSGVYRKTDNNSKETDMLFSFDLYRDADLMQWYNSGVQAHLVLNEGVNLEELNAKLRTYLTTLSDNWHDILQAQPYSERYLYGKYVNGLPTAGRVVYVQLFSAIALFILAIACINYMNFSTANAATRIKEIGVKKAIGANRKTLSYQYFSESILMVCLSLAVAFIIAYLLLPQFNTITGKSLTFSLSSEFLIAIGAITLTTGLIAGIYPALLLSGFNPIVALKGKLGDQRKSTWLRKGLVVFQFAVSVILIVSVLVIYKQVEFIQNTNLGYTKDHIISIKKEGKLAENVEPFLNAIKAVPNVINTAQMTGELPGEIAYSQGYKWEGMMDEDKSLRFYQIRGDYNLLAILDVELVAGRNFSRELATDADAVIMNETAIEMMQLENPVGQKLGNFNPRAKTKEIIGVVKDFHFQSLQEKVKPFFFSVSENTQKLIIKLQAGKEQETLAQIEDIYESVNDGYPFEFKFIDDDYQAVYAAEERITVLSKYFASIAILISCLGLLALTSFSTQRRFKEIAIRKVLGSSGSQIVKLLSSEYLLLVMLGIVIALPVGLLLMQHWLSDFAYRIELSPWYFVIAGLVMFVVAWFTVISQTAKSSKVNVTESLRSE